MQLRGRRLVRIHTDPAVYSAGARRPTGGGFSEPSCRAAHHLKPVTILAAGQQVRHRPERNGRGRV
jgi:hypothetical protein